MIAIKRIAKLEDGVFGVICHAGIPFAVSLERSFANLEPVIPVGTYECRPRHYNRGGYPTFEITGVAGHSLLLFHKANWETDLEGCVGVAESFAVLNGRPAIAQSGAGFSEFMVRVGGMPTFACVFEECY